MKVLCKTDLQASLVSSQQSGGLQILNGDASRAKTVSYNPVLDRATSLLRGVLSVESMLVIHPNESIAVRTKERFIVPPSCIGICVNRVLNTHNQLSIDATFIDPGYEGHLHFVIRNCGQSDVQIQADFPLAKVVFFEIVNSDSIARCAQGRQDIDQILTQVDLREKKRQREVERKRKEKKGLFIKCYLGMLGASIILLLLGFGFFGTAGAVGLAVLTVLLSSIASIIPMYLALLSDSGASEA